MNKIITISREYASGGRVIGKRVAEELGIELYDKDIVRETVKASGFEAELVEREEEGSSRTESILRSISPLAMPDAQLAIRDAQKAVILRFAEAGPCVIVGRCADEILREAGIESLNVFIHASALHRAVRAKELTGVTGPTEIQKLLARKDSRRHSYYTHYTGKRWGETRNYHLSLDSGTLGYETCVRLIVEAARSSE